MALTIASLPQPPSWQGVYLFISSQSRERSHLRTERTYGGANLEVVFADRSAVVHGVKGRNFVDTHGRHLKKSRNLVHDAETGETVLSLSKVEQRHDGRLLVLWRVALEDLIDDLVVLLGELEGDVGVVDLGISVL